MRRFLNVTGLSIFALVATGCAGVTVQPGHRAVFFDPSNGGIQHEVLQPGWYRTPCAMWTPDNKCPRVDDFDVTYSTAKQDVHTLSAEGLPLDLEIAVSYRPIVSEIYLLDTEIGPNYFDEVVRPEFRSAAINVFARTSYQDLQRKNGTIEDEIEKQLRDRVKGKHIEISSVLIEKVTYAPEILQSERERVVSQEQTLRNKQLMENDALEKKRKLELATAQKKLELQATAEQKKMELAAQTEQKKLELQAEAEQTKLAATTKLEVDKITIQQQTEADKFKIDSELRNKRAEKKLTVEQAEIDRLKAEAEAANKVAAAKGDAGARLALARATEAETRASVANITPMHVMMHAYDALGQLGGDKTTVMLGNWSDVPKWLLPKQPVYQSVFGPSVMPPTIPGFTGPAVAPGATTLSSIAPKTDTPY